MKQCITVDEQIALLRSHGVSFELMSESDAREFLYSRSYFFTIKSYATTPVLTLQAPTLTRDSTSPTSLNSRTLTSP